MQPGEAQVAVAVDAAWLCAAERDVEREEEERARALARGRRNRIPGKYERESDAMLLDRELREQRLEWRRKVALRRDRQLRLEAGNEDSEGGNNRNASPSPRKAAAKNNVYALENQRLTELMMDKRLLERARKKKRRPRIVDDMLSIEKRYAKSARRIQRWWRGYYRRKMWWLFLVKTRAATKIQRVVKGWLTRTWVRHWHRERTFRATKLQATFRGSYLRRRVLPTWQQWEFTNAAMIQSVVRMYITRCCYLHTKRAASAIRIQAMWRGFTTRRKLDIRWLGTKAVNLQRLVRGVQTRKGFRRQVLAYHKAATHIQRTVRGMEARKYVAEILLSRETSNRIECMTVLDAEIEWHQGQCAKLRAKLGRLQLEQQVSMLEDEYYREHERISDMESIYLDMKTQRMRVSPRAIEHGWVEEMEQKMKFQRKDITQAKFRLLFELGLELRTKEEFLIQFWERIRFFEDRLQKLKIWREEEFLDYWERECYYKHKRKALQKRRLIAEQRRRWRVKFFHTNGKIDTRWQGTRWNQQVLEDAKSKEVFCIGAVDILAGVQEKWKKMMSMNRDMSQVERPSDEEAVRAEIQALSDEIAAITASTQIEQTKAIFDPVLEDIEHAFMRVQSRQKVNVANRDAKRLAQLYSSDKSANPQASERPVVIADEVDRTKKKQQLVAAAKIPWHLLDELAAERHKLDEEQALFKSWGKISRRARCDL